MARMMVGMGEIGVMHPGNRGSVTELWTAGASPCVLLGIQKGTTALLAHIHRANDLDMLMQQVSDILGSAVPPTDTARAFIATEAFTGTHTDDARVQGLIITRLEQKLIGQQIRLIEKDTNKSAAYITYEGYKLSDGKTFNLSTQERENFLAWTLAYDDRFDGLTGKLPMAIRVGTNNEAPAAAVNRMFPK